MLLGGVYKYKITSKNQWLYLSLWFLLFVIAAFRGENVDNDHLNYVQAITEGWGVTEPSFYLISYICYDVFGSVNLVFFVYSLLAVSLLFVALKQNSTYFFLSLVIYFCTFYVSHELNQIRAAVGFGFAMLALKPWVENKIWTTMGYIALATLFHFSFMIFFPIYFLVHNNSKYIIFYILTIPLVYLLYFIDISVLSLLMRVPISYVQNMVINYSLWQTDVVTSVNVFSIMVFIKLGLVFLLLLFHKTLALKFTGFYLYLKLYIIGFILLIFMATLPGAAFRLAEMMWMVECFILPMLIDCFKPRWLATIILILLCTYWMWLNYIVSNFVKAYYFNFNF